MSDTTSNHLANERTFLAWIRTSISIIVFGFVVAKFGITLREFFLIQHQAINPNDNSLYIGIGFMTIGIMIAIASLIRYQITMHRIEANRFRPTNLSTILIGVFTGLFGVVLVAYLIMTAISL